MSLHCTVSDNAYVRLGLGTNRLGYRCVAEKTICYLRACSSLSKVTILSRWSSLVYTSFAELGGIRTTAKR